MRKFTKTEKDLCKKIVEKERRRIDFCDYYIDAENQVVTFKCPHIRVYLEGDVLLWQEHDCLEWLRERNLYLEGLDQTDECKYTCGICEIDEMGPNILTVKWHEGKTPLEALLRTVLAVMEK